MPGKPNYLSVPALKELEKIELIRQPNGNYKLDHAVHTQKVILGPLTDEWIKAQARLIGKDIQNAAMPEEQKDDDEDARTKSIKTIEAEISQTEEQLRRLKERCDKVSQKLDALYELKKHWEQEELLKAIDKSTRTKAEILAFLESHA